MILVVIINFAFAGVIASRNAHSRLHLLFAVTIFFNVLWAIGDVVMLGASSLEVAQSWSRLFFIAPMFTVYYLILFAYSFPNNDKLPKIYSLSLFVPVVAIGTAIALNSSYLVSSISHGADINEFVPSGANFLLYMAFFSSYFFIAYLILFLKSRRSQGLEKTQMKYILVAAILGSLFALVTNLSLPFMGNSSLVWFGPVSSLFYVFLVSYSIAKHRLFDIKFLVVRTMAYTLTFASVLALFGIIAFFLSNTFITTSSITQTEQLIYLSLALFLGVLYQPIKRFFDRATNTVFFRDSYDAQDVIDELTSILATQLDLDSLVSYSSNLLDNTLKPTKMRFVVFEGENIYLNYKLGAESTTEVKLSDIASFEKALAIIETANAKEKELMNKLDVEIILRLEAKDEVVGAILLGSKQSGSSYNERDIDLVRIGEKELAIAVQNSRYFEQIQKFNATLQREIEEATSELKRSNTKLKALDEAKDEFK